MPLTVRPTEPIGRVSVPSTQFAPSARLTTVGCDAITLRC